MRIIREFIKLEIDEGKKLNTALGLSMALAGATLNNPSKSPDQDLQIKKNNPSISDMTTDTSTIYVAKRYAPFSQEAKILFRNAARKAGLPEEWAESESLHKLLKHESGGWVGRPNVSTYGEIGNPSNSEKWGEIHDEIRSGRRRPNRPERKSSTATGLGQLLVGNVDMYYPSGRAGIGNAEEEAIGMLKYIKARHIDPDNAWANYNTEHEGY